MNYIVDVYESILIYTHTFPKALYPFLSILVKTVLIFIVGSISRLTVSPVSELTIM